MKIAVIGLGYVGCVTAAWLAKFGHKVIGVDVNPVKLNMLAQGLSPLHEPLLDDLIQEGVATKRLHVTDSADLALEQVEVAFVAVGTPSTSDGSINLDYVCKVVEEIAHHLKTRTKDLLVIVRSTVLPNTLEDRILPLMEDISGRKNGQGYEVCLNPEFLREGSAISDFRNPSFILVGSDDTHIKTTFRDIYCEIKAPIIVTTPKVAALMKYASNLFHGLKVSFANEIARLSESMDLDSREVMDIFVKDTHLNISAAYLKPGFTFGGPCLTKDIQAIMNQAKQKGLNLPVINAIESSNSRHLERILNLIRDKSESPIGIYGVAFKPGTNDLRQSPSLKLIKELKFHNYEIFVYDERFDLQRIHGDNLEYMNQHCPGLSNLMVKSMSELIESAKTLVFLHPVVDSRSLLNYLKESHVIIDCVSAFKGDFPITVRYHGIGW